MKLNINQFKQGKNSKILSTSAQKNCKGGLRFYDLTTIDDDTWEAIEDQAENMGHTVTELIDDVLYCIDW